MWCIRMNKIRSRCTDFFSKHVNSLMGGKKAQRLTVNLNAFLSRGYVTDVLRSRHGCDLTGPVVCVEQAYLDLEPMDAGPMSTSDSQYSSMSHDSTSSGDNSAIA